MVLGLAVATPLVAADDDRAGVEFFEQRIRPVLVERCYECHSSGAKKLQGGLRLDSRAAMRQGGDSGPAVVPKQVDDSLLVSALRHEEFEMPPGAKLPPNVIADFERWIELGAPDPRDSPDQLQPLNAIDLAARKHWAFQPIARPQPPAVRRKGRVLSPVDQFVLASLEQAGLALAPRADRATLVRRAHFDLLGLPPSPEEVDRFVADDALDAFARLVDRLLESPRYGERWGRFWLDVARYADNKGYVFFEEKNFPWAWTYRDYVIRAFNEDLPFDQFVLQQLAADRLDLGDDRRPLAALGYLTLGPRFMNNAHDVLDDRIDVVTRGLLGLTVTCARCHDHKFDPISQEDYYALYGVMRSSVEPLLPPEFLPPPETDEYRTFAEGMRERLRKLDDFIAAEREQIIVGARSRVAEYLLAVHRKRNHPDTENFMLLTDKGALNPAMIHRWEVYLKRARRANDPVWTVWHALSELPDEQFAEQAGNALATLFESDIGEQPNPRIRAAFAGELPADIEQVAQRYGNLFAAIDKQWRQHVNESSSDCGQPQRLTDDADEALREVLYGPNSPPMIPRELSWGFLDLLPDRPTQEEYKKLLKEVETWSMNQPGAPPRAMALVDAETPYEPVVFVRGNPHREGQSVERRYPRFFAAADAAPFSNGSGRFELAQRIVDPANPLTARVFVNRVWLHHFGRGLVGTPSDFGLRSETPSHPELLDWLATRFIDDGWSIKQLHRTIMNSAVYQQGSQIDESASASDVDPENRLLWHFPRRRLEFEALRDSLLAASGSLDTSVGGPPVDTVNRFTPRRTVYGFIDRMDLPGLMRVFDFPEPAASSPARERTTIAPQALFFMNNNFTTECARRLLQRTDIASIEDFDQRIQAIYRVLFSRLPDDDELALARGFLQFELEPVVASAWRYGYGAVDESTERVTGFTELRHWTGERWQAGPQLPDPQLGWVFVDREGGHPAATMDRCVIRRWIAPASGAIEISGVLKHVPPQGNGVRARIVSSQHGLLGQWKTHHSEANVEGVTTIVDAGDTIDFVVDFNGEIVHDEHQWPVTIRLNSPVTDSSVKQPETWDSRADFRGAGPDMWLDYVQALLMSNEFVFID